MSLSLSVANSLAELGVTLPSYEGGRYEKQKADHVSMVGL